MAPRIPRPFLRAAAEYALATGIVLLGLGLRFAASPVFSEHGFPFICFFPAVLVVALATGIGPSLLAMALSALLAWYFFLPPERAFFPLADTDRFALVLFVAVMLVNCAVIHVAKRSVRRLRAAQAELQSAVARRDEFMAFLAHELRTPLSAVKYAGLLAAREADGAARRPLQVQQRQIAHMERLVGDLLDGARLASGKIYVESLPLDLGHEVSMAVEAFRLVAGERRQAVALSLPDAPVRISGDASRLAQVVENLLSNASKFSPEGSTIRVGLAVRDGAAELAVEDQGKGLESADLHRIFGMYVQTQRSDIQKGGLGLGLPLARHIAERHGGSVSASSAGGGQGATFVLRIPLIAPAPA